jgi:hypothetical protein
MVGGKVTVLSQVENIDFSRKLLSFHINFALDQIYKSKNKNQESVSLTY